VLCFGRAWVFFCSSNLKKENDPKRCPDFVDGILLFLRPRGFPAGLPGLPLTLCTL
jgi:hypothetical protein